MQLLRDNKDSLMSVLDAFIHDPLVEWEDEKRKLVSSGLIVLLANLTSIMLLTGTRTLTPKPS